MRRWLSLACWALAAPALAQAPQAKLNQTISTLKQSKSEEAKLKRELESTRAELSRMRDRATDLAETVQRNERAATQADSKFTATTRALLTKEKEFNARKQDYARTVLSLIRMRQLPPTALFAPPEQLDRLMQTSEALQHTNRALAARANALQRDVRQVNDLRQAARRSKENAERQQTQLRSKQGQLAAELDARQKLQQKLSRDHASAQAQVRQLSRESASLQELIGKIEKARTAPQLAPKTTVAAKLTAPAAGAMRLPVAGSLLHRFGDRKNANETYRGIVLSARQGATVVAPAGGEVVFTGPFMDYGSMVLLKHGDGYISLLAGLGRISVGLNQQLARGEPIGTMGSPNLYVELRQRSKPIDPARWFANLPQRVASRTR